jgi:outer membrane receptor protein involved in Fe transport
MATAALPGVDELEEVRITASRVVRSGFTAPTPTTIVSSTQIEQRGATNIGQVLNESTAFRGTTTPQTNGMRAIFPGALYADLRGLGASRTLVLVDGKRFVPQITTGLPGYQVDLNQIPSLLLDRAEVVTGGASAQWGSDAVAGVTNLILKRNVQGFSAEVQGGRAEAGDNREVRVGILAGTNFADDRGHAHIAADVVQNDGVGDTYTRDWGRDAWQIIANPCSLTAPVSEACPSGGNGQPANLILPDIRYATATRGGLINGSTVAEGGSYVPSTLLRGIQFGPGGTTSSFGYGNYVGSQNMQGGGSNAGLNINTNVGMVPAGTRKAIYSRASYSFTDELEGYVEASYSYSRGVNQTLPARDTAIKIYSDNAFLPAELRDYMLANNITSFNLGRSSGDVGFQEGNVVHETPRVVAGLEGSFAGEWRWDAAYTYGENRYDQRVENDRVIYKFRAATDAVWADGQIVCRSSIPGAVNPEGRSAAPAGAPAYDPIATGCVPLNVLGEGSPSEEASRYVTDTLWSSTYYSQHAGSLNFSGEPGLFSIATGIEWRSEHQRTRVDPLADLGLYESTNAKSFSGNFNVKEAYFETVYPLAESLDLNGAIRLTDYSTSGAVTTWKVGATYSPVAYLLFRGAYSRDIRAPNLFELNTPPVTTVMNVRFRDAQPAVETLTGGNPDLEPEISHTLTMGVAWSDLEAGLQLSLDYFDIDVTGAIAALTSQQIADFCTAGQDEFCARIQPSTNPIAAFTIRSPFLNFTEVQRAGYDFALSWRVPVAALPGTLSIGLNGTYMSHDRENAGNGFIERAGQSNIAPRVVAAGAVGYSLGKAFALAQIRHISSGKFDNSYVEGVNINDNTVASATYLNLSGAFGLTRDLQIFGVVNNALDRDPPIVPASFNLPTSAIYFDTVGRSYRLGMRYRF